MWGQVGSAPPGVVVAREGDPAWVAAAALGAGRGQPVIWVEGGKRNVNGAMSDAEADELARQIEEGCEALGDPWRGIGDAIEAVTLCVNTPARLKKGDEHFAVTDRIGRHGDGERWAWTGQIFGGEVQASYQAMCALFLPIEKAWLFDGYPGGEPWSEYDMTSAGRELERRGLEVTVIDEPTQSAAHWRTLSARALSTDLVMVNTRGPAEIFNLQPGPCRAADVPLLDRPVAVHMVHSWSAVRPGARRTVGGRWIERGAYAYYGSTEEPFLQSFLTPLLVARRLYAPAPFSVAARRPGQLWKLAYFGDPLLTAGTAAGRIDKALPLEGVEDLAEALPAQLRAGRYGESARALVLLGRDSDLVRLAEGVLKDQADSFAEMAPHVALAAFRERDRALVARAVGSLGEEEARAAGRQDALWFAYWPRLSGGLEAEVLRALAANIREGNEARDATELAPAMADVLGRDAALAMLGRVRAGLSRERDLEEIDAMVARLGG
jgi:hypothetical protein